MTAAHRLAGIVAADVVGYSRLWVRTRSGRGNPTKPVSRMARLRASTCTTR